MAVLDPGDLLEQAHRLILPPDFGPPLQVDVRRAISSAYYSVFHFILTALADEFVGKKYRATMRYAYVYRSLDHRKLQTICKAARVVRPADTKGDLPTYPFERDMRAFAESTIALHELRLRCDYDPRQLFRTADALSAISAARNGTLRFNAAPDEDRAAFLTLLVCQGRRDQ